MFQRKIKNVALPVSHAKIKSNGAVGIYKNMEGGLMTIGMIVILAH